MKKISRFAAIFLCLLLLLLCSGCKSDYPVVHRQLDLAPVIHSAFEGTGMDIDLDDAIVSVSAVADRMSIDEEESQKAIEKIQKAVRNASVGSTGLVGVWQAEVDISPIICENFADIDGLDISSYFSSITVPAELTLTDSGIYLLRFSSDTLSEAESRILSSSVSAVQAYLSAHTTGLGKIMGSSLSTQSIRDIMSYVVNLVMVLLENGSSGYYAAEDTRLVFDSSITVPYELTDENTLQLSGSTPGGLLGTLTGGELCLTRA